MPKEPYIYTYRQDYNSYSDMYDKITVEDCRRMEKQMKEDKNAPQIGHDRSAQIQQRLTPIVSQIAMYYIKGEAYANKDETIKRWIERDQKKDEKLERSRPLEGIRCLVCGSSLDCVSKDLVGDEGKEHVKFLYKCPSHCNGSGRIFDEYGGEEKIEREMCPYCHIILDGKCTREADKYETFYTCPRCDYTKQEALDLSPTKKVEDPDYISDRQRFCLGKDEGMKYLDEKRSLEHATAMFANKEKDKEKHEKLAQVQKVTIGDLQKKLSELLLKDYYENFSFSPPEVRKDLIVEFTVIDTKSGRSESDSKHQLKMILKLALADTNWKLLSEGITYRMGFLVARLRCLEREEDLLKQIEKHDKLSDNEVN